MCICWKSVSCDLFAYFICNQRGEKWKGVQIGNLRSFHWGHKQEAVSHETRVVKKNHGSFFEAVIFTAPRDVTVLSFCLGSYFLINSLSIKSYSHNFFLDIRGLDCSKYWKRRKLVSFTQLVIEGLGYKRIFTFCLLWKVYQRIDKASCENLGFCSWFLLLLLRHSTQDLLCIFTCWTSGENTKSREVHLMGEKSSALCLEVSGKNHY